MSLRIVPVAAALVLALATPASAVVVAFSGTLTNTNPPAAPGGRCAPSLTVNIGPGLGIATGTSSLGAFVPTNSHCIVPPLPTNYFDGLFSFDFAGGDVLNGTYSGVLSATSTPSIFANVQNFIATGGTGRFVGATGAFTGTGTVTFAAGQPPASFETLQGTLNLPAVPEPESWALLVLGFGLVGGVLRRRFAKVAQPEHPNLIRA